MAYARGDGYSNHGYCNQYDQYDQYEYEQCNNGNIVRNNESEEFYFAKQDEHSFTNQPIRRRDSPIGANSTIKYVEHPQQNKPISPEVQRRIVSPNLHRRNIPISPERQRRHTIIVSPTRHNFEQLNATTSPKQQRKANYDQLNLTISPKSQRKTNFDHFNVTLSPKSPRKVNEIPLPPRNLPRKPQQTASYAEAAAFSFPAARAVHTPSKSLLNYYTPVGTSTPTKGYGDVTTSLVAEPPHSRRNIFQTPNRTAVISPTLYSKVPSPMTHVDDSLSKASWSSVPYQTPPKVTLGAAAILLGMCGLITCVLGLYQLSLDGRKYYLDLAFLSGFSSMLLGGLGFRARRWEWLPNRNYVSGYVILSLFSVLTASALVTIVTLRPKPGSPLADLSGGAICGMSVLSLLVAALGVVASHCCRYPPPDNRVQHGAEGFTL